MVSWGVKVFKVTMTKSFFFSSLSYVVCDFRVLCYGVELCLVFFFWLNHSISLHLRCVYFKQQRIVFYFFFLNSSLSLCLLFRMYRWIIINYLSYKFKLYKLYLIQFSSSLTSCWLFSVCLFLFLIPFGLTECFYLVFIYFLLATPLFFRNCYRFYNMHLQFITFYFQISLLRTYNVSSLQWYICISASLGPETSMNTSSYSLSFLD